MAKIDELIQLARDVANRHSTASEFHLASGIVALFDVDQPCGIEEGDLFTVRNGMVVNQFTNEELSPDDASYVLLSLAHAIEKARRFNG